MSVCFCHVTGDELHTVPRNYAARCLLLGFLSKSGATWRGCLHRNGLHPEACRQISLKNLLINERLPLRWNLQWARDRHTDVPRSNVVIHIIYKK